MNPDTTNGNSIDHIHETINTCTKNFTCVCFNRSSVGDFKCSAFEDGTEGWGLGLFGV